MGAEQKQKFNLKWVGGIEQTGFDLKGLLGTGIPYLNEDEAVHGDARRFETTEKFLHDAHIVVTTKAQLFGDVSDQTFEVAVGDTLYFKRIDISKLYFKNETSGQNGTVTILATEE